MISYKTVLVHNLNKKKILKIGTMFQKVFKYIMTNFSII